MTIEEKGKVYGTYELQSIHSKIIINGVDCYATYDCVRASYDDQAGMSELVDVYEVETKKQVDLTADELVEVADFLSSLEIDDYDYQ